MRKKTEFILLLILLLLFLATVTTTFMLRRNDIIAPAVCLSSLPEPDGMPEFNDGLIDINLASAQLLTELPGIGPKISQRIVEYRNQHGPFKSIDELLHIKGIGPVVLSKIKPFITIGGTS